MRVPHGDYFITRGGTFHIWGAPRRMGDPISVRLESMPDTVLEHLYKNGWLRAVKPSVEKTAPIQAAADQPVPPAIDKPVGDRDRGGKGRDK